MKEVILIDNFLLNHEINYLYAHFKSMTWKFVDDMGFCSGRYRSLGISKKNENNNFSDIEKFLLEKITTTTIPNQKTLSNIEVHRVYYNAIRYGDKFKYHIDGTGPTFLIYGNKEWNRLWGGHTIIKGHGKVLPKPGRLIIFPGNTLHKASSPTRFFKDDARFSIVFQTNLIN